MTNEDSKRDRNRKMGFVLMGVGFVSWLIFRPILHILYPYRVIGDVGLFGDIGLLLLVAGVIIFLINPEKRHEKADAGVRLGSWIIDVTIVYVVVWTLTFLSGGSESFGNFLGLAISAGYFTYFFGKGQTLGMKAAKIKLCGTDGTYPIGYGKGFLRWLGMMISTLVIGLGFLWILVDKNNQGWHDKIAGTYVLDEVMTMKVSEEGEKEEEIVGMYIPNEVVATEVPEEWEKEEKSKVRVRVLDLRSPKERLVTALVRESLRPEVDQLIDELIDIGRTDGFLSMEPGGKFNKNHRNIRAREIGMRLNEIGRKRLMQAVYYEVHSATGMGPELNSTWAYIGEGGECWLP
jgi:uncharacterized RDD family membrane protein YckC